MSITFRVSITKEVLEATKDCDADSLDLAENCAISYAVREIWPFAITGLDEIQFHPTKGGWAKHDQLEFISKFDVSTPAERARMQPFSFEIEVPDEVIGEVNIEEIRGICEGSKTLEIV